MPELPEVEVVRRQLEGRLLGARLGRVLARHPQVLPARAPRPFAEMQGRRVEAVQRRGKLLLLALSGGRHLTVHLRMTGRLFVAEAGEEAPPHTHLRVELDGGRELRFCDPRRFGRVGLHLSEKLAEDPFLFHLGPEPGDLRPGELGRRLARRRGCVKGALLDQRLVAGLGNIYVDEILFAARIHPRQESDRLRPGEAAALQEALQRLLEAAIAAGGSTIRDYRDARGRAGAFQQRHRVFGRAGLPCLDCGATVRRIVVVGRGTHFCPGCQRRRRRRPRRREVSG